jgi:GNAT superfamily N-acetyltransferase
MSAQAMSVAPGGPSIAVRCAKPEDAPVCGRICFDAFYGISTNHGFPPDFPSPDVAVGLLSMMFSHPGFYCVVAESDGRIVGSNCLDERSATAGIGPITVDPSVQNLGVGRKLMEAVLVHHFRDWYSSETSYSPREMRSDNAKITLSDPGFPPIPTGFLVFDQVRQIKPVFARSDLDEGDRLPTA